MKGSDWNTTTNHGNDTQITLLYPLIGLGTIIMSLGYLFMALKNYNDSPKDSKDKPENDNSVADEQTLTKVEFF